jgi:hypothetical protein
MIVSRHAQVLGTFFMTNLYPFAIRFFVNNSNMTWHKGIRHYIVPQSIEIGDKSVSDIYETGTADNTPDLCVPSFYMSAYLHAFRLYTVHPTQSFEADSGTAIINIRLIGTSWIIRTISKHSNASSYLSKAEPDL